MKKNSRTLVKIFMIVATCILMSFSLFACNCAGCDSCKGCAGCNEEYEYVEYGTYAQSLKAEDVTVSETPDVNGYYTGSDNAKYVKVTASPFTSGYTFSTNKKAVGGATVEQGSTYYFKVEPIKWRVIAKNDDNMLLVCDTIIDTFNYCDCSDTTQKALLDKDSNSHLDTNNYKESEIREWLNGTFLQKAFSSEEIAGIHTVTVENGISSTENYATGENVFVCEDTEDKVYLLSYVEVYSSDIIKLGNRNRNLSDYARAVGCRMDDLGAGAWWLRSPSNVGDNKVCIVGANGVEGFEFVSTSGVGVVPVIQISNTDK